MIKIKKYTKTQEQIDWENENPPESHRVDEYEGEYADIRGEWEEPNA